jgi:hypothetical protein
MSTAQVIDTWVRPREIGSLWFLGVADTHLAAFAPVHQISQMSQISSMRLVGASINERPEKNGGWPHIDHPRLFDKSADRSIWPYRPNISPSSFGERE